MASVIAPWAVKAGLDLSKTAIMSYLDIQSLENLLQGTLAKIETKMDRLIQVPYRVAIMDLREGKLEKAKDKLKDAVNLEPFNLPAKLLYIYLLCFEKKYDLALDYYLEFLEQFSFRKDLIPPPLYKAYTKKVLETKVLIDVPESKISLRYGNYESERKFYVDSFWCSPKGIAIRWGKKGFLSDTFAVNAFNWRGKLLFETECCSDIKMVTGTYVVVEEGDKYTAYSLEGGSKVEELTEVQFKDIFLPVDDTIESMELYRETRFTNADLKSQNLFFRNMSFQTGTRVDSYIQTSYSQYGYFEGSVDYEVGTLEITFH